MMNFAAYCFIAFFCAFGFICLLRALWVLCVSREAQPLYILIPCDAAEENIELKIKAADACLKRAGASRQSRIIVLDSGMSEMTKEVVLRAAEQSKQVLIMCANELQNLR